MLITTQTIDTPATLFEAVRPTGGDPVTSELLTRSQTIERIITHNPTASIEFLEDFSEAALRSYLDHLVSAQVPRGPLARWVRPGDTPGIVMAEPRD
jgi:hypothetical protein